MIQPFGAYTWNVFIRPIPLFGPEIVAFGFASPLAVRSKISIALPLFTIKRLWIGSTPTDPVTPVRTRLGGTSPFAFRSKTNIELGTTGT